MLVVPALVYAAYASWSYLPGVSSLPDSGVKALLPAHTPAIEAEATAAQLFGSSLLPRIEVVQRNPNGLTLADQRRIVRLAVRLDEHRLPGFPAGSSALPYLNTKLLLPGSREPSTTAITYLGFPDRLTPQQQNLLAQRYAARASLSGAPAQATGFIPGSVAQSALIASRLRAVEIATIVLVALILGVYFRSVVAPLVTLASAAIAYLISIGVIAYLAQVQGVRLDREVEPIVVVLLLGVVTDYSVFLLSGMRARLRAGEPVQPAATCATRQVLPIIVTAALLVAAGLATLRLASIGFVQALGPAMAVVVLVSLAVTVTFVPAAMHLLGRALFWPGLRPGDGVSAVRNALAWGTSRRAVAIPAALLVLAALFAASLGLSRLQLALTPISGLGGSAPPRHAALEAARGFTAGMIAPTEIVLRRSGVGRDDKRLLRFAHELEAQPEVGAVLGAGMAPLPDRAVPVLRTRSGDAVRYFVALRHHPYSAAAVGDLGRLQQAMPRLLRAAGLRGTDVLYAGDTALARETIGRVTHDLLWVGLAAALVNVVLLAIFLRSLVAPFLLVATSGIAIAATFGITALVFRRFLGEPDLTYFVPLAAGVLLLSFGTDYNLFVVGRIWQEAKEQPVAEAVRVAVPKASRAISIAGVALAGSFAMLAIVPIAPFRELAVAIAVCVVLDTFVVRTILIPALLTAVGGRSWWPGRRGRAPLPEAPRTRRPAVSPLGQPERQA